MDPYYDIVRLMRMPRGGRLQLAEGVIHLEPTAVEVMGEVIDARFAAHVTGLYEGASCLVYMGEDENVVIAVW